MFRSKQAVSSLGVCEGFRFTYRTLIRSKFTEVHKVQSENMMEAAVDLASSRVCQMAHQKESFSRKSGSGSIQTDRSSEHERAAILSSSLHGVGDAAVVTHLKLIEGWHIAAHSVRNPVSLQHRRQPL